MTEIKEKKSTKTENLQSENATKQGTVLFLLALIWHLLLGSRGEERRNFVRVYQTVGKANNLSKEQV